jgi:competence protein ComFC
VHSLFKTLLDIFYPLHCGGCGTRGNILCGNCIDTFRPVEEDTTCPICGRLIGKSLLCGQCMEEKRTFRRGYFGFYFEGRLRDTIHAFKFSGRRDAGRQLVRLVEQKLCGFADTFDCIVPLPVTERRLLERGFNQSFIVGEEISNITGKEIYPSVLVKTKKTEDQYTLSKEERKKNIRGVFTVKNSSIIKDKRVLLVDDLFTTGYTAQEASRTLLKSSVKEVIFFALARTPS